MDCELAQRRRAGRPAHARLSHDQQRCTFARRPRRELVRRRTGRHVGQGTVCALPLWQGRQHRVPAGQGGGGGEAAQRRATPHGQHGCAQAGPARRPRGVLCRAVHAVAGRVPRYGGARQRPAGLHARGRRVADDVVLGEARLLGARLERARGLRPRQGLRRGAQQGVVPPEHLAQSWRLFDDNTNQWRDLPLLRVRPRATADGARPAVAPLSSWLHPAGAAG